MIFQLDHSSLKALLRVELWSISLLWSKFSTNGHQRNLAKDMFGRINDPYGVLYHGQGKIYCNYVLCRYIVIRCLVDNYYVVPGGSDSTVTSGPIDTILYHDNIVVMTEYISQDSEQTCYALKIHRVG